MVERCWQLLLFKRIRLLPAEKNSLQLWIKVHCWQGGNSIL
nr:MAG TPA: hypothetical protein [Caudoviricetes sp.]DAT11950.1 MAG TPA: hypothetical protein [Bacteriophage sp.]